MKVYPTRMKTILATAVASVLLGAPVGFGQTTAQSSAQPTTSPQTTAPQTSGDAKSDAFYYFTQGHLQELQYDETNSSDMATQCINSYKKALELDPNSAVVLERLAEIHAKTQHIRDAVTEAQEALKIDPNNVDAHRLLARIYVRSLGDMSSGDVQQENLGKAVAEFEAILKVDPSDVYSGLWLARLYRFQNHHEQAEKVLRQVLQHEPDNGAALEQLSQLLIDEGRSQEAIDLLSQASENFESPDLYDLLGDAYSQAKNYAKAQEAFQKAVDADPSDPGHRHGLAEALLDQDKYAEALAQYKKLAELEPGSADNYLREAQLYRRLGQLDQAEASLAHAKQLSPASLEILFNEALLYEDENRYDDAIKVLTDAIAGMKNQTGSGNINALTILYEQLGRAYRGARNYPEALKTYDEMSKVSDDAQKRAQMLTIDTYSENHELDKAIDEARKAIASDPNSPDLTVKLAMLYGEKSETPQATQLLQGLLHGNEGDAQIYIDIAQVQERGRKYADAEQTAQKAETMAQDNSAREIAWFLLGSIYERQKKYDLAEQEFRKALDADPNNAPVLNYYGYMLADRGVRVDEAASMIQRALKVEPNNGAYLDSLGWAYYKQNKLTEAEEYLRRAIDREGDDPTILSHLADVYLKLGQNERAADLFERSLAQWQKASPADYEPDKVSEVEAQLKNVKKRLAQKSSPDSAKPQ